MAGTESNEPFYRITMDNNVWDGALIGAGIGAVTSGAVVGAARMRYSGVDRRNARDLQILGNQKEFFEGEVDRAFNKFEGKKDRIRQASYDRDVREKKIDKINQKSKRKLDKLGARLQKVNDDLAHESNLEAIKQRTLYGRHMGGWRNAAIIGASSVIGGGVGMISDGLSN